ncbi:MAG: hypothetical protein LW701_03025 [Fluviicola sp.]|nr:hypothetical protein [Fluviicola sp.]
MKTAVKTEGKKFENYSILIREDGIVQIEIIPDSEISVDEIIEGTNFVLERLDSIKAPVLFIANEFSLPSKESREYLAKKESLPYSLADAYVINSFPQKIAANFYLKVNKPARPTKMFNNKEDALIWLKTYM